MRLASIFCFATLLISAVLVVAAPPQNTSKTELLKGWLSDEQCECVAKGKKIVLVDPIGKRILVLSNQDIGRKNVGDYVEISGEVDSPTMTLHANSLKFLEKGNAMCGVPPKKAKS
jgi:hypothetical protein